MLNEDSDKNHLIIETVSKKYGLLISALPPAESSLTKEFLRK